MSESPRLVEYEAPKVTFHGTVEVWTSGNGTGAIDAIAACGSLGATSGITCKLTP
jgi:hypothetical protein